LSEKLDDLGTREIYFIGIIDLLQQWNNRKHLENIFKGLTNDKTKISSVSPKLYASRFIQFVEEALVVVPE
jgi:1-phosphatidylinositol-4-phosphate 5-kinase